jgi:parvulin-like peptidyl-prolyl isomerase
MTPAACRLPPAGCRLVACGLWLVVCGGLLSALPSPDPVLAIAGRDTLRREEFQLQLAIAGGFDVAPENIQPMLETWADGMLLWREAERQGLGEDETTRVLAAEAEKDYVVGLMSHRISDTVRVSENEIFDYYNRHKTDFVTQLRMQYAILPDEKAVQQALTDLKKPGAQFKALAQERSLERSINPAAELTLVGRNDTNAGLDPVLEDTIFTLPVGKLSLPLNVNGQYWLVEVTDRIRLRDEPGLDKVHDFISKFLELKKKRAVLERAVAALRKSRKVIFPKARGDTLGVLAQVGDSVLTRHRLLVQLTPGQTLSQENEARVIEVWINSELFAQEARRLGVGSDETTRVVMRQKTRDYVTNLLLDRMTRDLAVSNNDVFDYFQKHKDEFRYAVKVLHILCGSDSVAEAVLADVKKGVDFQKLARERSADRATSQGEESPPLDRLGQQGQLNPELEEAVFSLPVGAVSPLIHTNQGYWLVKVTDRKQVRNDVVFDDAKERINTFLHDQSYRQAVDGLLTQLQTAHPVQLFPMNYWAN